MARRKLARKGRRSRRAKWPRKPGYKQLRSLHAHEERVVVALLIERGSGGVESWTTIEPDRWHPTYLRKTFGRLRDKGLVRVTNRRRIYRIDRGRYMTYDTWAPSRRALGQQEVA